MLATNLEERVDDGRNQHGLLELGVDTRRALRGGPVFRFRRERRSYALRFRRCTGMAVARFRRGVGDRKSVVEGKSVAVRVDLGGRRLIKKKNRKNKVHDVT